jgi:phospholipid transport system transporter-binding protein
MITTAGERLTIATPMVIAGAAKLREQGEAALAGGAAVIDLSAVTEADSSAVAVLLAWTRSAGERGQALSIVGAPASVRSLANLYGVAEMLPLA